MIIALRHWFGRIENGVEVYNARAAWEFKNGFFLIVRNLKRVYMIL
jgi:hypothetical protein